MSACLLLASCAALSPYRSLAFSVISGTLASACETGQSRFTPAIGEFVPGYDASGYFGFGAPKSTPADIIDKLNKEIRASVVDPPVKEKLVTLGIEPMQLTPAEYGKLIADETEKWAKVVKAAGIKVE